MGAEGGDAHLPGVDQVAPHAQESVITFGGGEDRRTRPPIAHAPRQAATACMPHSGSATSVPRAPNSARRRGGWGATLAGGHHSGMLVAVANSGCSKRVRPAQSPPRPPPWRTGKPPGEYPPGLPPKPPKHALRVDSGRPRQAGGENGPQVRRRLSQAPLPSPPLMRGGACEQGAWLASGVAASAAGCGHTGNFSAGAVDRGRAEKGAKTARARVPTAGAEQAVRASHVAVRNWPGLLGLERSCWCWSGAV